MATWFKTKDAALSKLGVPQQGLLLQREKGNHREYGVCPVAALQQLNHDAYTHHDCYPGDGALCDVVVDIDNNSEGAACRLGAHVAQILSMHWERLRKEGQVCSCRLRVYSCSGAEKESYHVCVSATEMCFVSRGAVWDVIVGAIGLWGEAEGDITGLFHNVAARPVCTVDLAVTNNGSLRALGADKQQGGRFVGRRKRLHKKCDVQLPLEEGSKFAPKWETVAPATPLTAAETSLSMGFNRGAFPGNDNAFKIVKLCRETDRLARRGKELLLKIMGAETPKKPRTKKLVGTTLSLQPSLKPGVGSSLQVGLQVTPSSTHRPNPAPKRPLSEASEPCTRLLWIVARRMCKVYQEAHNLPKVEPLTKASVYVYDRLCGARLKGGLVPFASHQRIEVATSCKWCDRKTLPHGALQQHSSRCVVLSCDISKQPVTFSAKCFSINHTTSTVPTYLLWGNNDAEHEFAWELVKLGCGQNKRYCKGK